MPSKSQRIIAALSDLPQFSKIDPENGYLVHTLSGVKVYPVESVDPERGLLLLRYSGLSAEVEGEFFLSAQKIDAAASAFNLDFPVEDTRI